MAGCGTDKADDGNTRVTAAVQAGDKYNDTDVMYLQMMVAHHEQGLEMVRIAEGRATKPELATLVKAVDVTQADEVTMMKEWLTSWSRPATVDHAPSAHADHGGLPAIGPEEMKALRQAQGSEFESTFINLFVAHQHNAVEMANMERTGGANEETKAFAERVRQSRTDQIRQLLTMLNS
ncbi:DUF305 domain-containing protein [Actinoplanes sp. NPDC049265]|uniref:DUF305 domain-containing protein n=1 Tax=Actinoplanes sp. NPDC049265 TaxID=3363902 RepID=UPI00371ED12C